MNSTINQSEAPTRSLRSMDVDQLEARIEQMVAILPEELGYEWLGDLSDEDSFADEAWVERNELDLKSAFWNAVRIVLRDLIAHDTDIRLPHDHTDQA
jgi:poly-D-alanine transfer protein DltD